jgi:PhnB protein
MVATMTEIHELYPRLVVEGGDAALAFYGKAFGGEVTERFTGPDGKIVHAMVAVGPVRFAVKDADEFDRAPTAGAVPVIIALYVSDPDAVAQSMVDAGATTVFPVADQAHGERAGRLADPFGHLWMLARPNAPA